MGEKPGKILEKNRLYPTFFTYYKSIELSLKNVWFGEQYSEIWS